MDKKGQIKNKKSKCTVGSHSKQEDINSIFKLSSVTLKMGQSTNPVTLCRLKWFFMSVKKKINISKENNRKVCSNVQCSSTRKKLRKKETTKLRWKCIIVGWFFIFCICSTPLWEKKLVVEHTQTNRKWFSSTVELNLSCITNWKPN